MIRRVVAMTGLAACLAVLVGIAVAPLEAYLKLGADIGGRLVPLRWDHQPIRYFVSTAAVDGVTAADLRTALGRAFQTWSSAPRITLSSEFAGFTSAVPNDSDNASVIGFVSRPDLDRTLAATTFTTDDLTGEVLESDVFVNSAFAWSVAPAGQSGRFDLEAILVHEVGHLLGLGHSALGETALLDTGRRRVIAKAAVMFPIAFPAGNIEDRRLQADDRAGIADTYSVGRARRELGSISGRVTRGGAGVYGAHVTAFNTRTQELTGTFTLSDDGSFVIASLLSGIYIIRVEPLDDVDLSGFFENESRVILDFVPTYYPKLVAVPAGGSGAAIQIPVQAK